MEESKIILKQKLGLLILGFIVLVVCLELLLRVFGSGYLLYRRGFQGSLKNNPSLYKILCLGDSFTLGVGAGKDYDYPSQLENILNESNLGKEFKIINEGIGGQNSSELIYSLDANLDKYKPEMVVLMTGMNDGHNTHLHNWALGQRGWYTKLSSWITGLRIYKLFNFTRLSIEQFHNSQELNQEVDLSRGNVQRGKGGITSHSFPVNITKQEANAIINEAKRLFKNGQNEKAKNLLVETSNKENVWEYLNIAKEYNAYETEEYIIKKMLSTDAKDEWLRFTLGKIYLVQNKFDDAEIVFRSILEKNPNNNYIRFDLASLYMSQKRYYYAEGLLKDAIKVHGDSLRANKLLFYCYEAQGDKNEAGNLLKNIKLCEKITDLNLSAIKSKILSRGMKLIFMSYPIGNYVSQDTLQGVMFIDNERIFNNFPRNERSQLFAADNNHCNAEGYKIIAKNVCNYIKKMNDSLFLRSYE